MAVVNGFAGMRDYEDGLRFDPVLPRAWKAYQFKLRYRGRLIGVEVSGETATYRLLEGDTVQFTVAGKAIELSPANPTGTSGVR